MKVKGIIAAGVIMLSLSAAANDEYYELARYSEILEKNHPYVLIGEKNYEMEYELRDMEGFMFLEIEVEECFLGSRSTELQVRNKIEPIAKELTTDIKKDFNKPVRVAAEYEGENIFIKKY